MPIGSPQNWFVHDDDDMDASFNMQKEYQYTYFNHVSCDYINKFQQYIVGASR